MLSDLAFALSEQGLDITVITSRQRYDDPQASLAARETCRGVKVVRVATPRFGRDNLFGRLLDYVGFYLSATFALARLAGRESTVIAKTDPPLISIPAALVCLVKRARLVNWLQDLFPEVAIALGVKGMHGLVGRTLQRLRNWSLRRAETNVVIGDRMRQRLIDQGIDDRHIQVIHNWADGEAIQPIDRLDNPLRAEWGLRDKFVVGYSGNLGRAHEFTTLLETAELLRDEDDVVFLFIGGGALSRQIKEAARAKGLENLMFKPYQPRAKLAQSLGIADVHVVILRPEMEGLIVPSKYYGIAAAGRPVLFIGDTQGEIAQMLKRANGGGSVAPGDPTGAAKSIRVWRANRRDNSEGTNARMNFDSHYSFQIALRNWIRLLPDPS